MQPVLSIATSDGLRGASAQETIVMETAHKSLQCVLLLDLGDKSVAPHAVTHHQLQTLTAKRGERHIHGHAVTHSN